MAQVSPPARCGGVIEEEEKRKELQSCYRDQRGRQVREGWDPPCPSSYLSTAAPPVRASYIEIDFRQRQEVLEDLVSRRRTSRKWPDAVSLPPPPPLWTAPSPLLVIRP